MISLNKTAQLLASQDIDDISDMQQVTGDYRLNKEEIERLNGMLKEIYLLLRDASQDPQKEGEKYHIHLTVFKNR